MRLFHRSLSFLLVFVASVAFAETIQVEHPPLYDVKILELGTAKTGSLQVILQTNGIIPENYKILLKDLATRKLVQEKLSDKYGIALFNKISPGRYLIELIPDRSRDPWGDIKVADYLLKKDR